MQGCICESAHVPHTSQMGLAQARDEELPPFGDTDAAAGGGPGLFPAGCGAEVAGSPNTGLPVSFRGVKRHKFTAQGLTEKAGLWPVFLLRPHPQTGSFTRPLAQIASHDLSPPGAGQGQQCANCPVWLVLASPITDLQDTRTCLLSPSLWAWLPASAAVPWPGRLAVPFPPPAHLPGCPPRVRVRPAQLEGSLRSDPTRPRFSQREPTSSLRRGRDPDTKWGFFFLSRALGSCAQNGASEPPWFS